MGMSFKALLAAGVLTGFGTGVAQAATEVWTFDATLTSGVLLCGDFVGDEAPCQDDFGAVDAPSSLDDLMRGLTIGGTYSGRIELEWSGDSAPSDLVSASCELAGGDCAFSTDLLTRPGPVGDGVARLDFSDTGVVGSLFNFAAGSPTYSFSTDYIFDEDRSLHYYAGVSFDLSNVTYSNGIPVVPLPASAPILLSGLLGLAWLRRRKA